MPKMKTRKSAAKRYSFTGTGKIKYKKMGLRHILTNANLRQKDIPLLEQEKSSTRRWACVIF